MYVFKEDNGNKFKLPEDWSEVTLGTFLKFMKDDLMKAEGLFEGDSLTADDYRFIIKYVGFWAQGIDEDRLQYLKKDLLLKVYILINESLSIPESIEVTNVIEFEKELYFLPMLGMSKSTVFEFVEAAEVEHRTAQLKDGYYAALPHLCSILLRKKDEVYDKDFDEYTRKVRAKQFLQLPMSDAFKVGFFLLRQKKDLNRYLSTFSQERLIQLQDKLKTQPNLMKVLDGIL